MVSVLMSVYNEKEKDLRQAIDSILNQTYQLLEFIIVLDNPQNILLKNILLDYQKHYKKIILLINDKNLGLAGSLNKAFLYSKGKYIARMDADDISYPMRIEKQVQFMEENKKYAIVGTNRIDIDENDNVIRSDRKVITDPKKIERILKYGSPLSHPSIIMQRNVFEKLGGYRMFQSAQDYDLYLRCLSKGLLITNLEEPLIKYRIRKNSISNQNSYLQMLSGDYIRKINIKAKQNGNCSDKKMVENFGKYCIRKGLYNSKIVLDYMKYTKALKKKKYLTLIFCILKNPSFSILLLKSFRFHFLLKILVYSE